MAEKRFEFVADRNSGIEGCIYCLSECLEVIRQSNLRNIVKFPFYAQTIDDGKQQCIEWIDAETYKANAFDFLRYSKEHGTDYLKGVKSLITEETNSLFTISTALLPKLKNLSDFDLAEAYSTFMKRYKNATALFDRILQTNYKSFVLERDEFLLAIKNEKNALVKPKLISEYLKNFYFMQATYSSAPVLDVEGVLKMAAQREAQKKYEKKQNQKLPDLSAEEKIIVSILQETEIIRDQRKKANLIGMYMMFRFLDEWC